MVAVVLSTRDLDLLLTGPSPLECLLDFEVRSCCLQRTAILAECDGIRNCAPERGR